MENEIKRDIANFFLSDSRQFLYRYEQLRITQTEISNRSKLLIDIVFSFECSLKALVFLESELTEKETYKIIRKCGHDLKALIDKVDKRGIEVIISKIDEDFEHFSISSRYTLDANIHFRNSHGVLDESYYSTIANPNWLENLYNNAKDLYNHALSKSDISLEAISLNNIDIEKELEKFERLRNLNSK